VRSFLGAPGELLAGLRTGCQPPILSHRPSDGDPQAAIPQPVVLGQWVLRQRSSGSDPQPMNLTLILKARTGSTISERK